MNTTIMSLKNRIHVLEMRDPVTNRRIINKLNRRLKKLEAQN